ncbi:MAG: serine hydrolase domain-containing protein [Bacteroidota bacterium]
MIRFLFTLTFLLLNFYNHAQLPTRIDVKAAGFSEERLARLSDFWEAEIEAGKIPSGVCMIIRNGVIAHQATYGYNNFTEKEKIAFDQIFYVQSMTKPIISVAMMMLYEEGHFELGDRVSKYLPQFKNPQVARFEGEEIVLEDADKPITIAHLFTHTAGFSHGLRKGTIDQQYWQKLYGGGLRADPHKTIEERVNTISTLPLIGHPGEQWYYSASPDILALLIEQFSGKTTAEFLQERIFNPLGMTDTGYNLSAEKDSRVAHLHAFNNGKLISAPQQTPTSGNTVFGGTHGLFSTAEDYLKFASMLLNKGESNGERLLSRKTVELMTINHVGDLKGYGEGFGLGFGVRTDLAEGRALGTEGQFYWNGMFNTYFFVDPKENMIAVMMTQLFPFNSHYSRMFRQMVYQAIDD